MMVPERQREFLQNKLEADTEENHFETPEYLYDIGREANTEFQPKVGPVVIRLDNELPSCFRIIARCSIVIRSATSPRFCPCMVHSLAVSHLSPKLASPTCPDALFYLCMHAFAASK